MSCFAIEHKAGVPQGGYMRVSVSPTEADGYFPRALTYDIRPFYGQDASQ